MPFRTDVYKRQHLNRQRAGAVGVLGMEYYKQGRYQSAAEHSPFGWAYVSSNYSFLNSSNQVMKVLRESGRYLSHEKQMYLVSRQQVSRGGFTVYSISDIQNIVISLGLGSGLVITALVLMTLWMLLNLSLIHI